MSMSNNDVSDCLKKLRTEKQIVKILKKQIEKLNAELKKNIKKRGQRAFHSAYRGRKSAARRNEKSTQAVRIKEAAAGLDAFIKRMSFKPKGENRVTSSDGQREWDAVMKKMTKTRKQKRGGKRRRKRRTRRRKRRTRRRRRKHAL